MENCLGRKPFPGFPSLPGKYLYIFYFPNLFRVNSCWVPVNFAEQMKIAPCFYAGSVVSGYVQNTRSLNSTNAGIFAASPESQELTQRTS